MATSGSSSFNASLDDIVQAAARQVNAIGKGVTMGAAMKAEFKFALNAMVKAWQAMGIHVWTNSEGTLFPQPGQIRYAAGPSSTDHITETYYETAATNDLVVAQTVLGVDDTSDMTIGDYIGIVLASGLFHWTTVTGKTSTTVTIATGLTDDAAAGNAVFSYTSKIAKPLAVPDMRRYDIDSGNDTPIDPIARKTYMALPSKNEAGTINQVFYDPQLTTGYFYLWRVPENSRELLKFTWRRPIMDFNSDADNPDLPQEWILCLYFNLAEVMLAEYPVSPQKERHIKMTAAKYLDVISGFDREAESINIQPDMDG